MVWNLLNKIVELDLKKLVTIFLIGLVQIYLGRMLGNSPMMGLLMALMIFLGIVALIKPDYLFLMIIGQIILVPSWISQYLPAGGKVGYFTLNVLTLALVALVTNKNVFRQKQKFVQIVPFLFLLYIFIQSLNIFDKETFMIYMRLFVAPIIFFLLIKFFVTMDNIKKIFDVLIISGIIASIVMIIEFIFFGQPLLAVPDSAYHWTEGSTFRPGGTLGAAPNMGVVLSMLLPLSIAKLIKNKDMGLVYKLAPAIISTGIFLSFTRAPWLGAIVALIAFVLTSGHYKRWMIISILASAFTYLFYFNYVQETLPIADIIYRQTMTSRFEVWRVAANLLTTDYVNLFIGRGFWHSASILTTGITVSGAINIHNTYLALLIDFGIIGFLIFMSWTLSLLVKAFAMKDVDSQRVERASIIASIIAFLTASFFGSFLQYGENINFLFFTVMALLVHIFLDDKTLNVTKNSDNNE